MPHCIIEYSNEIEKFVKPIQLTNAVYQGALKSGLFKDDDIKTRSIAFDSYQSGSLRKAFVHVTVKIFSGRNLEQKKTLSELIISQLKTIDFPSTLLTVEVVEIEKESYAKVVI
ncbi:MAG: 5-carboxymethyl-2-hydroxymuconate Delta-isomerase [Proteobacteria bacterium]|nr:5-carboxymethyl-2-hydroxymuconate Delta-isomerase [Pseudomonadota bacterium]